MFVSDCNCIKVIHIDCIKEYISYLNVMHSTIPSRIRTSKEISNRDIVSQVVYGQILNMGLATPVSVSCHKGKGETVGL